MDKIVDQAIEALAPHEIYQRSGALVDIVRDADVTGGIIRPLGAPRTRLIPPQRLRELLDGAATWLTKKNGKWSETRVPQEIVKAVAARGEWAHIRPLNGTIEWPVLRPDGSVLSQQGYDLQTQLFCVSTVRLTVPDEPTQLDANLAAKELQEVVAEFPFAGPEHASTWIAALLTVLARPAIAGPTPLFIFDAASRGTGKTLCADVIGTIIFGKGLPRRALPDKDSEWRKAMLAIAIAADAVVLLDNVTGVLRSAVLDMVLTGTKYQERLLGENRELSLPVRTVFIATVNNAMISEDLSRRSLLCRLEAADERPEHRSGFKHDPLLPWVLENRARLLSAALTILRAHAVAGRPPVQLRPMGSYEAWSAIVRAPLVWAGLTDPVTTQDELRDSADMDREDRYELLHALYAQLGGLPFTAAIVTEAMNREALEGPARRLQAAIETSCNGKVSAKSLGYALRKLRGQRHGGLVLQRPGKDRQGYAQWVICQTSAHNADDAAECQDS